MIIIFYNLLACFMASIWSVLVNDPCTLEKHVYSVAVWSILNFSLNIKFNFNFN